MNPPPYVFSFPPAISGTPDTQKFVFTNNYQSPAFVSKIVYSDPANFSTLTDGSDGCTGMWVAPAVQCTFFVGFYSPGVFGDGTAKTSIAAMGTIPAVINTASGTVTTPAWYNGETFQLASAGATGTATPPFTISQLGIWSGTYQGGNCSGASVCNGYTNSTPAIESVTITNTTQYNATITGSSTAGSYFGVTDGCNGITLTPNGGSCTITVNFNPPSPPACTLTPEGPEGAEGCTQTISESIYTGAFTLQGTSYPFGVSAGASLTYNWLASSGPQVITITGAEQSAATTTAATAATGAITLSTASQPSSSHTTTEFTKRSLIGAPSGRIPSRELPSSSVLGQSTLSVGVGGFKKAVNIPAGTAIKNAAAMLAVQLNAAGSPVKAVSNGSVISLTSQTTGSAANLPLSASVIGNYQVTPSGNSLTGGKSAATAINYDSGTVQVTTNGATASAEWGSASTPQSIATALAAAINQVAGSYWKATANDGIVSLASQTNTSPSSPTTSGRASVRARKARTTARGATSVTNTETTNPSTPNQISVTVTDSAGFASPSFNVTTN